MRLFHRLARFGAIYTHAIIHASVVFSIGLRLGRNRQLVNSIAHHGGYRSVQPTLEQVSPDEVSDRSIGLMLLSLEEAEGNVSTLELAVISSIVAERMPRKMFELGTFDGRTTLNLAANAAGATVYTLDLPASELGRTSLPTAEGDEQFVNKAASGTRFLGTRQENQIVQLYGDSATFDFAPFIGEIDLVFIDAAHSYEYVVSDSNNALKLLRSSGGVILWHDYSVWDGVTSALNEMAKDSRFEGIRWIKGTSLVVLDLGR